MVRYLAGWGRVVQGYTSSVSVSLLPRSPSRLVSGLPVTVLRLSLSYMLLSGVSLTPRHVTLNPSPYSLILYLSCQPSLPPAIFNPQIPIRHPIPPQFSLQIRSSPFAMNTWSVVTLPSQSLTIRLPTISLSLTT